MCTVLTWVCAFFLVFILFQRKIFTYLKIWVSTQKKKFLACPSFFLVSSILYICWCILWITSSRTFKIFQYFREHPFFIGKFFEFSHIFTVFHFLLHCGFFQVFFSRISHNTNYLSPFLAKLRFFFALHQKCICDCISPPTQFALSNFFFCCLMCQFFFLIDFSPKIFSVIFARARKTE